MIDLDRAFKHVFVATANLMRAANITEIPLTPQSSIKLVSIRKCDNCRVYQPAYACLHFDTGKIGTYGSASYCTKCEQVTVEEWNFSFGEKTLPLLKLQVCNYPEQLDKLTCLSETCPSCLGFTYQLVRSVPTNDFFANRDEVRTWVVCANPSCTWPGTYDEHEVDL